jgi:hypothetical protein
VDASPSIASVLGALSRRLYQSTSQTFFGIIGFFFERLRQVGTLDGSNSHDTIVRIGTGLWMNTIQSTL